MRVFRLARQKYTNALNGKGAARYGNRWNSKGVEVVYTAESRSLAMAEVLVHLTLAMIPTDYVMMEIDIPSNLSIRVLEDNELPTDWNNHPFSKTTQEIGDRFILEDRFPVMKVPSTVVPNDFNYLINPRNIDFAYISIVLKMDFPFDKRLFG